MKDLEDAHEERIIKQSPSESEDEEEEEEEDPEIKGDDLIVSWIYCNIHSLIILYSIIHKVVWETGSRAEAKNIA